MPSQQHNHRSDLLSTQPSTALIRTPEMNQSGKEQERIPRKEWNIADSSKIGRLCQQDLMAALIQGACNSGLARSRQPY
jgi:hypothetical protein